MIEATPKPESNEDALRRLEGEKITLREKYIKLLSSTVEQADGSADRTELFNMCLVDVNEYVDHFIQPDFDKDKDLDSAKEFYLQSMRNNGAEFITKRGLGLTVEQLQIVCQYVFENKKLERRIQALIDEIEALKSKN